MLPAPIYTLSHDGRQAVVPNFSRLQDQRPGYGYPGVPDPWRDVLAPEEDGITHVDLETGATRLLLSIAQVVATDTESSMRGRKHWFNHLLFNPDDSRFIFLHRWIPEGARSFHTRMFTVNADGTGLYRIPHLTDFSHFIWRNSREILVWAKHPELGHRYFVVEDQSGAFRVEGEGVLTVNGHCTYSPDGRWILTDTYPDAEEMQTLILYRVADSRRFDIGRFPMPRRLSGELRCDLHPRWSRDGRQVCVDFLHHGARQMAVLDVGEIVAPA